MTTYTVDFNLWGSIKEHPELAYEFIHHQFESTKLKYEKVEEELDQILISTFTHDKLFFY